MTEKSIDNFEELHQAFSEYRADKSWIFRGQSNCEWNLLPKVGRPPYIGVDEKLVFNSWKRAALEYVKSIPVSDWEWLAIAQHHGLATRLLDWTTNPVNACYFAVRESYPGDAIVYATTFNSKLPDNPAGPYEFKDLSIFRPHRVVPRITRQGGLFTIHPVPTIALNKDTEGVVEMHRIVISERYREQLHSELSFYGTNAATLFPDLDGLSEFVNWTIEKKEYWKFSSAEKVPFG
jgi:hypothetical protein